MSNIKVEDLRTLSQQKPNAAVVAEWGEKVLALNNNELSFYFMCYFWLRMSEENMKQHRAVIINGKNGYYIYYTALHFPGDDINALTQGVIESGWAHYIYMFAKNIPGADINALAQGVIKIGDVNYCYQFASNFSRELSLENKAALAQAVIASASSSFNYSFAETIPGADINAHASAVISSRDYWYCFWYARHFAKRLSLEIKTALAQVVIDSGNAQCNYSFVEDVPGADIKAHGQVIIANGDLQYISKFLKKFSNQIVGLDALPYVQALVNNGAQDDAIALLDQKRDSIIKQFEALGSNIPGDVIFDRLLGEVTLFGYKRLSAFLSYHSAGRAREEILQLSRGLINNGTPDDNFAFVVYFADILDPANIMAHGQVIIANGGAQLNYNFALYLALYFPEIFSQIDIGAYGKAVIRDGDPWYNYRFARDFPGADVEGHCSVVNACRNRECIRKFRRNVLTNPVAHVIPVGHTETASSNDTILVDPVTRYGGRNKK